MKVEGGGKYHIKLVPSNCHREEVVFEIISALDHLNTITDEIFTKLRTRVLEQNTQVSSLTARVSVAAEKVAQYKSSTKGIQILSPAKFPEPTDKPTLFPIIFLKSLPEQRQMTDSKEIMSRIQSQRVLYESPVKHTDELLQYYRVQDFNYSRGSNLGQLWTKYEVGLGNSPAGLDAIDSFFLFNSSENPYKNYTITERSGTSTTSKIRKLEQGLDENGKLEGNAENLFQPNENETLDDFYYYPSSVQIPNIDVPDHLPDLPGLSDTLTFEPLESTSSSLFSFQRQSTTTTPPTVPPTVPPSIAPTKVLDPEPLSVKPPTAYRPFVPPPPPPPPSGFLVQPTTPKTSNLPQAEIVTPSPGVVSSVAPTPPPPPPIPEDVPKVTVVPLPKSIVPKTGNAPDLRSSLMAAIRDAGGKSTRNLTQSSRSDTRKKKQEEKEKSESGNADGGDLMADLKNSLAMRRRGISGMNDARNQPGLGDIMQKIASSIPTDEDSMHLARGGNLSEDDDWD